MLSASLKQLMKLNILFRSFLCLGVQDVNNSSVTVETKVTVKPESEETEEKHSEETDEQQKGDSSDVYDYDSEEDEEEEYLFDKRATLFAADTDQSWKVRKRFLYFFCFKCIPTACW